jgi:hypothetical protein
MRFIAFGCSYTWGDGILPGDSWDTPPSIASWVQNLSTQFNIPVVNLASSGGSNSLILHQIKSHNWQEGDIALILWTFLERNTIYDSYDSFRHLSSYHIETKTRPYVKEYYTLFPEYHISYTSLQSIEHAYLYLLSHNIPMLSRFLYDNINLEIRGLDSKMLEDLKKTTLYQIVDALHRETDVEPLGADGMHFNALVHRMFANAVEPDLTKLLQTKL